MSHITGLRIDNFGRYKGTHELALQAKVYSIVAERTGEPGRSNWCGKSTIMYAIRWCLTGIKPKFARVEADIVTKGEREGGVDIELSDTTFVSRRRAGTSDLMVVTKDGVELRKNEAQDHIDAILGVGAGMGANDVWFLDQKAFDRILTMDPGERSDMAMRWFGLEKFANASVIALLRFKERADKLELLRSRRRILNAECVGGYTLEQEVQKLDALKVTQRAIEVQYGTASASASALGELIAIKSWRVRRADLLKRLPVEGDQRTREDYRRELEAEQTALVDARLVHVDAQRRVASATNLVSGEFDGQCPITCEACPVAGEITANRSAATKRRQSALAEVAVAMNAVNVVKLNLAEKDERVELLRKIDGMGTEIQRRIADYRERLAAPRELTPDEEAAFYGDDPADPVDGAESVAAAEAAALVRYNNAHRETWVQNEAVDRHKRRTAEIAELERQQVEQERETEIARWAARVFGKSGVTKTIITEEFGAIEDSANALLATAGIDLGVSIQWGREIQGMALACDTCGHTFGKPATPKVCPICSTTRQRKTDDKLFVEATATSGGADNLAGSAVQMAVGAYLRQRGGCELGVICIDEPFGALDEHNRSALAATIATTLDGMLLEQAFIISHTPDTADATPGRIVITATGDHSAVAVAE